MYKCTNDKWPTRGGWHCLLASRILLLSSIIPGFLLLSGNSYSNDYNSYIKRNKFKRNTVLKKFIFLLLISYFFYIFLLLFKMIPTGCGMLPSQLGWLYQMPTLPVVSLLAPVLSHSWSSSNVRHYHRGDSFRSPRQLSFSVFVELMFLNIPSNYYRCLYLNWRITLTSRFEIKKKHIYKVWGLR